MAIDGSLVNQPGRQVFTTWQREGSAQTMWMCMLAGNVVETSDTYTFTMNICLGFQGYNNLIIWEQGYFYYYDDAPTVLCYGPYQQFHFEFTSPLNDQWIQETTHVVQKETRSKRVLPYAKLGFIARPNIPATGMGNRDNHYSNGDYWIYGTYYGLLDVTGYARYEYGEQDMSYNGYYWDACTFYGNGSTGGGYTLSYDASPIKVSAKGAPVYVYDSNGKPHRASNIYVYDSSGKPRRANKITVYDSSGKPHTTPC